MIDTIYVEEQVREHPRTREICARFPRAQRIFCQHYQEVFNRKAQNFRLQKQKPSLILAAKQGQLVLPAPPTYGLGEGDSYYFSHLLNCPYDCRYCFLQGMFRSAHYVLFVNYEDFIEAIRHLLAKADQPAWFFSGYDCDSLALEPVTGFAEYLLPRFAELDNAWLELRTKSTQIRGLLDRPPLANTLVAFTLSPELLARAVEHKAPGLEKRLRALRKLQQRGWPIGLRFDPLLYYPDWATGYRELFEQTFALLDADRIHSVSLGLFRLPVGFAQAIHRLYPHDPLLAGPLEDRDGLRGYQANLAAEMLGQCREMLLRHFDPRRLFICQ